MTALEYGAGTGLLGFMLRDRFADLTLADVSDGMLEVAARKIAAARDPHVRAVKLDLLADPCRRGPLRRRLLGDDAASHSATRTASCAAFIAVLTRPGFLCIADLDTEDGSFHGAGFDGHLGFDRDRLAQKARAAGFANVRFVTAYEMTKAGRGTIAHVSRSS